MSDAKQGPDLRVVGIADLSIISTATIAESPCGSRT